ncbi:MAG: 4Fe-4S cluster-binding domain-containing protein [Candidatus Aegiribacteria sp.]|nr:4Fe-4S cluster-binding domain-containing protein [Candidatus Aegiribacteria sp.]MBD3294803.1 4Fe-4S cluster-binding domain-containing protein [Candidatus Fermentibacteria bacterium]
MLLKKLLPYAGCILRGRLPGQLIIQMTSRCNATCPQCGMRVSSRFKRSTLSAERMKRMLDSALSEGVAAVSFTGGEPLLEMDLLIEMLDYAGKAGIEYLRTGTNGFVFRGPDKPDYKDRIGALASRLAGTSLRNFWISIDSHLPQVHEEMRGFPGIMEGIERALPVFHGEGLYPAANLGINRKIGGRETWKLSSDDFHDTESYLDEFRRVYSRAFDLFFRRVENMGFTMVNSCYPMSVEGSSEEELNAVYTASSADRIVKFSRREKAALFEALSNAIKEHRSKIRIFSPLTSLHVLQRSYSGKATEPYPCRGGIDYFFVDAADGKTYPCGYRGGEDLGYFWELRRSKVRNCTLCDWECFRDPSELMGLLAPGLAKPGIIMRKMENDPEYFDILLKDLLYYSACGLFNGRQPPDLKGMRRTTVD